MRRRIDTSSAIVLGLLGIAALVLALAPTLAAAGSASCSTQTDNDQDGFWDCNEQNNLVKPCGQPPDTSLSSTKKDLFVFLVRANPSNIPPSPFDPFKVAKDSLASANPSVTLHVIENPCNQLSNDRIVSDSPLQKAIKITELLDTSVNEVGSSIPGVPSGQDEAKIYTNRIWNKLLEACPCLASNTCGTTCQAKTGEYTPAALYQLYIQNTIAHEIGHIIGPLHQPYTTQYEYHSQEGSNTPNYYIMERVIVATRNKKTGVVTIPIATVYGSTDLSNIRLLP